MRSCSLCFHREVCKFYHGEMSHHDYWGKDFIKELKKLQRELAQHCKDWCGDGREDRLRVDRR